LTFKKIFLPIVLASVFALLIFTPVSLQANQILVTINGSQVNFSDQGPTIVDGRTLVPVRGVFEELGFEVNWEQDTQTAKLTRNGYEVTLTIGSASFTTNGESHTLDVPAQIIGGRTMLPIRAVLESVGYSVNWIEATNTVSIGIDSPISSEPEPNVSAPIRLNGNWSDSISEVSVKDGVFEIYKPEELAWVATAVNSGQNSFAGRTIKLMENIDLAGKEWTPIAAPPIDADMAVMMRTVFAGTFDGNYKTIKNLSIGSEGNPDQYGKSIALAQYESSFPGGSINSFQGGYIGLFGRCSGSAVIRNLGMEDVSIHSDATGIGALIGDSMGAYMENCYSTGVIKAYSPRVTAGGLIGKLIARNEILVKNCYSTVTLSNSNGDTDSFSSGLGGLIGQKGNAMNPIVVNCYATGRVSSAGRHGGLLGGFGNYTGFMQSLVNSYHNKDVNPYFVQSVDFFRDPAPERIAVFARSAAELRTQSTFVDWDFVNIWAIDANINDGFPYLRGFQSS